MCAIMSVYIFGYMEQQYTILNAWMNNLFTPSVLFEQSLLDTNTAYHAVHTHNMIIITLLQQNSEEEGCDNCAQ